MAIKKMLFISCIFLLLSHTFCFGAEINKDEYIFVSLTIKFPKLPDDWRIPSPDELNTRMRPQSLYLFPDYFIRGDIDRDKKEDYAVLAIHKNKDREGCLAYLSSLKQWVVVDAADSWEGRKVGMTLGFINARIPYLTYGSVGARGYSYIWDREIQKFVKVF